MSGLNFWILITDCSRNHYHMGIRDVFTAMPYGDIDAETPAEIAVAVLAQVIQDYRATTPKSEKP